jgi:outer membrane protein
VPTSAQSLTEALAEEDALRLAADANPNLFSAGFTELAARDNIDVVRGQLLPQISVVEDLDRSASAANTIASSVESSASIMMNGTMALYEGGAIYPLSTPGATTGR